MFHKTDILAKELYKPGEVGKLLSLSSHSIIKYCNRGIISCVRNHNNHRRITAEEVCRYLDTQGLLLDDTDVGKSDVIYARVSTHKQAKRGDLERQIERIKLFAVDHNVSNLIVKKDIASGLNDNRKQLLSLLSMVREGKVNRIFILYKDRLTRFGFNYLKQICDFHYVEIVVVSDEENTKSQAEELAEDIATLTASLPKGLRRQIKEGIDDRDKEKVETKRPLQH